MKSVFFTYSGWLVNFLCKICTLYPRMCSSHTAVVKALLLNPLIFKQCAPATLSQTTSFLCCSILTQESHLRKCAYQWKLLTLFKQTLTYLKLKGVLLGHYYGFLTQKAVKKTQKHIYLVHTLQTIIANLKPLDDFHLNLHELNILNLLTNISM